MADITKCSGKGCDLKESCYRFTSSNGFWQSYFLNPPIVDGKCDYFWGDEEGISYSHIKDTDDGSSTKVNN